MIFTAAVVCGRKCTKLYFSHSTVLYETESLSLGLLLVYCKVPSNSPDLFVEYYFSVSLLNVHVRSSAVS